MGKVDRTKLRYSLQMTVLLEDLIKLMMVVRQEFMEAIGVDAARQISRNTFNKSPACAPMNLVLYSGLHRLSTMRHTFFKNYSPSGITFMTSCRTARN